MQTWKRVDLSAHTAQGLDSSSSSASSRFPGTATEENQFPGCQPILAKALRKESRNWTSTQLRARLQKNRKDKTHETMEQNLTNSYPRVSQIKHAQTDPFTIGSCWCSAQGPQSESTGHIC